MSVYLIADIEVNDRETYEKYVTRARPIVEKYGGRYVASSENIIPFSGDWKPAKMLVIEFDDLAGISRCFKSPEYLEIAPLRQSSSTSRSVIVRS